MKTVIRSGTLAATVNPADGCHGLDQVRQIGRTRTTPPQIAIVAAR
jgi:hypothetical protein